MNEGNDRYVTRINAIDQAVPADKDLMVHRIVKFRDESPAIGQCAQRRRCVEGVPN
jgi:hypothetical protein